MEISMDRPGEEGEDDAPPMEVADRRAGIEHELMERDRAAFIRRAVAALPEKQRAAVLLHKYQEMDYDEIARVLECSESALKSLLFRAYETLRIELAPLVDPRHAGKASQGAGR
jgi:RNA polymerase sigma-70 factor (ECF subfamily)